jgi:CBS domain-containing protein
MISPNEWPLLLNEADVESAIKILRINTEDSKLLQGHSTPLVLDGEYNLLGFVHLIDLLRVVKPLCQVSDAPCEIEKATMPVRSLVVPFAGQVEATDSIMMALDIMMEHRISLIPVLKEKKLVGIIKLSDIFNAVASLLFDKDIIDQQEMLMRRFHL